MLKTVCYSILAAALSLSIISGQAEARIQFVEVQAEGSGVDLKTAIYDALQMAISKVNGTAMSAREAVSLRSVTVSTDDTSNFRSSEKFRSDISTATKGVVKSFSIINSSKNEENEFLVKLVATIAKFKQSKQTSRLRIAVIPLGAGKGVRSRDVADDLTQALVSQLTQTRKFAIIDRDYINEQNVELDLIRSGNTPVEELAKLGNRLSTDYMLVGKVSPISFRRRTKRMRTINAEIKNTDVNGVVSYRIIDVATGQVKFSDQYRYSVTIDGHVSRVSNFSEIASLNIVEKIQNAIFPLRIESVRGNNVYIGQGGKNIRLGQIYKLVQLGRNIKDSYTKESLGREEITVGRVKIVDVQSKQSVAKILKSSVDVAAAIERHAFIIRPLARSASSRSQKSGSASVKKVKKEAEDELKALKKKSEKDW